MEVPSRFGQALVDVCVPTRQAADLELDTDDFSLAWARTHDEPLPPASGQLLRDWNEAASNGRDETTEIRRVLVRVNGPADKLGPPRLGTGESLAAHLSDEVLQNANHWYDVLRSWIEVVTMQDLDHLLPKSLLHVEGVGIATFAADGSRLGYGGTFVLDYEEVDAANVAVLRSAIIAAGERRYPPLAHQILRDARAAWYRGQPRRAVIDAATATEVSLAALASKHGTGSGKKKTLMLGPLIGTLEDSKLLTEEVADNLRARVVTPRNRAVHEAVEPTSWSAAEACQEAQRQVMAVFPLGIK